MAAIFSYFNHFKKRILNIGALQKPHDRPNRPNAKAMAATRKEKAAAPRAAAPRKALVAPATQDCNGENPPEEGQYRLEPVPEDYDTAGFLRRFPPDTMQQFAINAICVDQLKKKLDQ